LRFQAWKPSCYSKAHPRFSKFESWYGCMFDRKSSTFQ
jgi:hypothetical protein